MPAQARDRPPQIGKHALKRRAIAFGQARHQLIDLGARRWARYVWPRGRALLGLLTHGDQRV
jgi:hypothetical protein